MILEMWRMIWFRNQENDCILVSTLNFEVSCSLPKAPSISPSPNPTYFYFFTAGILFCCNMTLLKYHFTSLGFWIHLGLSLTDWSTSWIFWKMCLWSLVLSWLDMLRACFSWGLGLLPPQEWYQSYFCWISHDLSDFLEMVKLENLNVYLFHPHVFSDAS